MIESRIKIWLLIGLWLMVFTQCSRDQEIIKSFDRYPTSQGNQWLYEYSSKFIPYDSNGVPNPEETISFFDEVFVEIDDEDYLINDTFPTIQFISYSMNSPERKAYSFYTNDNIGLLHHAYKRIGYPVLAKKSATPNIQKYAGILEPPSLYPTNWIYSGLDSIFIINPPNKSLIYPLKVNSTWTYVNNYSVEIQKSIIDIINVTAPAGRFECYKVKYKYIRSSLDSNNSVEYSEYYAKEGLIKRISTYSNVLLGDPTGESIIFGDAETICELKEYSIK